MTNSYTDNMINFAVEALRKARETFKHNPLQGHTSEYTPTNPPEKLGGASVFQHYQKFADPETLVPYVMGAASEEMVDLVPGANGAFVVIWGSKSGAGFIGWTSKPKIEPDKIYIVKTIHGSLQLTTDEDPEEIIERTDKVSFVFTPEIVGFVLASIHPGLPDPTPDWDGLQDGDQITGSEALRRNITRVKKQ